MLLPKLMVLYTEILKISDISDVHIWPSVWPIIAKISSFDQHFWHFRPFSKFSVIFKIFSITKNSKITKQFRLIFVLSSLANFWRLKAKAKDTRIFEIFGRPFLRKFRVFSGSIETVNGTQCLRKQNVYKQDFQENAGGNPIK